VLAEVFRELQEADVRYALVGGLAVTLHGHLRSTADIDIVLTLDDENLSKFVSHFKSRGWKPVLPLPFDALLDPTQRADWITNRNLKVFAVHHADKSYLTLDVLLVAPMPVEQIVANARSLAAFGSNVSVASIPDLITMKRAVGRPVDISDIEGLEELLRNAN
jgi:hypothetical protein